MPATEVNLQSKLSLPLPNFTVGFVYNEPCPLKCDFCCHTKENVGPGKLSPELLGPVIDQFSTIPSVTRFAFTGGDPFVYIHEILSLMRAARAKGVAQPFHIVTSGFWAKSEIGTQSIIYELADAGMDRLYVSYDLEHAKWVTPEQVYRIEDACIKNGVAFCVYGVFWDTSVTVRDLLPDLKTTQVESSLVAPIGRALTAGKKLPRTDMASLFSCGKPQDYDLTIYPNGDTYPCCSGGFNKKAKLLLGNVFSDSASDIIAECKSNFLAIVAKEIGFDKLFEKARAMGVSDDKLPTLGEMHSVCELCSRIGGDEELKSIMADSLTALEIEFCTARYMAIKEVVSSI